MSERSGRVQAENDYINCNFILGSSAEVEQVWRMCLQLLFTLVWAGMFPITLEIRSNNSSKYNQDWWAMAEVQEALHMSIKELGEMFEEIMAALHDEADHDESDNEY